MSPAQLPDPIDDDDEEEDAEEFVDKEFDFDDDDELAGRLPGHEPYGDDDELFTDPDEGLPPEQARSRRAMLGVPEFDEDEDNAPSSPTRAMQDAIIEEVNDLLDDEWSWDAAAEKAYEAIAIDPTYGRAANALLRCYLAKAALREMQHALDKLFDRGSDAFNQRHRIAAYSYRVLSRADFWLEWYEELPPEVSDVKDLIEQGHAALIESYFEGRDADYQTMRRIFREALDKTHDRPALMWYLARLYAGKGYFADSAALLGALLAVGAINLDVQRLYAEMLWWRDHHRWLPWVH